MSVKLSTSQTQGVSRISGLVLMNALIFQEVLAEHDGRVKPLQKLIDEGNPIAAFTKQWQYILHHINYYSIFHVACEILQNLTSNADVVGALRELVKSGQHIVSLRAALRHDLMGRVYHRLLADAKYLGTYYTSIPAATLLLKLALRPDESKKWGDTEELAKLRIADLACGTGTLLMAAADTITDAYIRSRAGKNLDLDIALVQRILAEEVIHGYDVLPSAIHLTASTLALRAPQIAFRKMNLHNLPHGGPHRRLGSIEFLETTQVKDITDLFGSKSSGEKITGTSSDEITNVKIPPLDLCIMNPPFTRSVGGNLLFGSLPDADRKKMQKRLSEMLKKNKVLASSTAGLGSVFVAIADRFIKEGGRIGLVLPKAVLSGVAWDKTRELLRRRYRVEFIVSSHDPTRWNFSENTDLSEVLIVARKEKLSEQDGEQQVVALNLWRNPTTTFEALALSNAISKTVPNLPEGQGSSSMFVGESKVGEEIGIRWKDLRGRYLWMLPAAFAQTDLTRIAFNLMEGKLNLGTGKTSTQLPLSLLSELGTLGPDRRDIHDGFKQGTSATPYPAFWGHDADSVFTLAQEPNQFLTPLSKAKANRPLRKLEHLWPLAGRVLIGERLWIKTQKLVAVKVSEPVLSNMWWSFIFKKRKGLAQSEKSLTMWMNSSLGILMLLSHREETRGAWIDFKKPVLASLPVLNLDKLSPEQMRTLSSAYDKIATKTLLSFPQMATDEVRAEIDDAIRKALGLPDFSILRKLLAQEPVVCLNRL